MASPLDPPSPYGYASNPNISRLIMMGGEERARAAERAGEIWANSIGNIGNIAAGAVQQSQEIKQEQKKQAQMAARDAATADAVRTWDGDPKSISTKLIAIRGPKEGLDMADKIIRFSQNGKENDPEKHLKVTHAALGMYLGETPELQEATYPQMRAGLQETINKAGLSVQLPEAYSPDVVPMLKAGHGAIGETLGIKGPETPKLLTRKPEEDVINPVTGEVVLSGTAKPVEPKQTLAEKEREAFALSRAHAQGTDSVRPKATAEAEGDFGQYVRTSPTAGRTYMSAGDFSTPKDKQSASNYAKAHGIPYIDKDNGVALQEITNAASDLRDAYAAAKDLFPESKLGTVGAQAKEFMQVGSGPALKAYEDTVADVAIRLGRATSGGKGLRFSKDLIAKMQQAVPSPVKDVKATADDKMKRLDTYLKNVEDAIFPGASASVDKGPKTVHSQAEVDALPAGTVFIDSSDGKKYKKGS